MTDSVDAVAVEPTAPVEAPVSAVVESDPAPDAVVVPPAPEAPVEAAMEAEAVVVKGFFAKLLAKLKALYVKLFK